MAAERPRAKRAAVHSDGTPGAGEGERSEPEAAEDTNRTGPRLRPLVGPPLSLALGQEEKRDVRQSVGNHESGRGPREASQRTGPVPLGKSRRGCYRNGRHENRPHRTPDPRRRRKVA